MPDTNTQRKMRILQTRGVPALLLSRSDQTTRNNRTGDWRFARPVYADKTAPCSNACPAGEDIPRIETLVARADFKRAWEVVMRENPFPAICGCVCFHPCEGACNRLQLDFPLAIRQVERTVGELALKDRLMPSHPPAKSRRRRIALVGAGPAGLSAAYFLNNLGYECHVYEAHQAAGGVLRWGIPAYRLPLQILAGEISRLERLGVRIHCGSPVTPDIRAAAGKDFQAVFVGCGHARSLKPGIKGQELMSDGLAYLRAVRGGVAGDVSGKAVVIGGGNTAVDVARTLIRSNIETAILYRRRLEDMPAFEQERAAALAEGVAIRELVAPISLEAAAGRFNLTVQAMRPTGETDGDGRARVAPTGDAAEILTIDKVFAATGAEAEPAWEPGSSADYGQLALSHCLLEERDIPILYGGDMANPVLSVPHAVMSGKQAAMALDVYFRWGPASVAQRLAECQVGGGPGVSMDTYNNREARRKISRIVTYTDIKSGMFAASARTEPVRLSPERRIRSFSPVEACLAGEDAAREARRCFSCGTCNDCGYCGVFCPEMAALPGERPAIDLDYCKGCGICVEECPRNAMHLEAEAS